MAKRESRPTAAELAQLRRIDQAARVLFDAIEHVRLTKAQKAALDALGEALFDPASAQPKVPAVADARRPSSWADSFVWKDR